jgi:hypothetical protein
LVRRRIEGNTEDLKLTLNRRTETHSKVHRRWLCSHVRLVLISLFFLTSCASTRIHRDAEKFSMAGLPCTEAGCMAELNKCPAKLAETPHLCDLWKSLASSNSQALETERSALTWGRHPDWPTWSPFVPSQAQVTDWSPAKDRGGRFPRLCLAMSGGGLRSAAVNLGVLSGLRALQTPSGQPDGAALSPVLEQIDIMSGVSGGSSALAWYFTQHWHRQHDVHKKPRAEVDQELFNDTPDKDQQVPEYQRYLRENFVTFTDGEYVVGIVSNIGLAPINLLANGVFGWHMNTSPMRSWYESRLRKTFQHDPRTDGRGDGDPHMKDLREENSSFWSYQMPWPIVNATALIEHDLHHYGARLGNVVFQFTPEAFGSDAFGRHSYETSESGKTFTLGRVVSIASAAFDATSLVAGPSQSMWWSVLNLDTGLYVHNPNLARRTRTWHRLLPFPTYYFNNYLRDVNGTDIYLTDGGHSENLGAYALVRRGCTRIIIVDAEHDPTYIFDAYRRLQKGLRTEMGVSFEVPDIERRFLQPRPARDMPVCVDGPRWGAAARHPVMNGQIAQLPAAATSDKGSQARSSIPVLYIKMAYHSSIDKDRGSGWVAKDERPECSREYDPGVDEIQGPGWVAMGETAVCSPGYSLEVCRTFPERRKRVQKAFENQRSLSCSFNPSTDDYGKIREKCPFPQRSTKVQEYSADDYDAWRDLGRLLIDGHTEIVRCFLGEPRKGCKTAGP